MLFLYFHYKIDWVLNPPTKYCSKKVSVTTVSTSFEVNFAMPAYFVGLSLLGFPIQLVHCFSLFCHLREALIMLDETLGKLYIYKLHSLNSDGIYYSAL